MNEKTNKDPRWNSLKKLWNLHRQSRGKRPIPDKIKMQSTALAIINLQRDMKLPVTIFEGVF